MHLTNARSLEFPQAAKKAIRMATLAKPAALHNCIFPGIFSNFIIPLGQRVFRLCNSRRVASESPRESHRLGRLLYSMALNPNTCACLAHCKWRCRNSNIGEVLCDKSSRPDYGVSQERNIARAALHLIQLALGQCAVNRIHLIDIFAGFRANFASCNSYCLFHRR